jgi:hypothetical protein
LPSPSGTTDKTRRSATPRSPAPSWRPEPSVRVSLARQQQKQLDEITRRAASLADEIFTKRLSLKVHDYAKDGILVPSRTPATAPRFVC